MSEGQSDPYVFAGDHSSRLVSTAIHAGHDTRPEVGRLLAIDQVTRLREEDPCTDQIAACGGFRVLVTRSRFEVDLNRRRDAAVYLSPDDAWNLQVWQSEPSPQLIGRSLEIYDQFYADLGAHLDRLAATGPFVVFDVHSYNHRRDRAADAAAPPADNPDVNVGTGSMDKRWRWIVEGFMTELRRAEVRGQRLDVRENVRFTGGHLARWVHERYPTTGCALAIEFKKTFMDEWTGMVDVEHLRELSDALAGTVPAVLGELVGAS